MQKVFPNDYFYLAFVVWLFFFFFSDYDTAGAALLVELLGSQRLAQLAQDAPGLPSERRALLQTVGTAIADAGDALEVDVFHGDRSSISRRRIPGRSALFGSPRSALEPGGGGRPGAPPLAGGGWWVGGVGCGGV